EHAHDHALVVETLLRNLADHDVRVVAVGGDHDGVGLLDPGLAQDLDVHAVAEDEAAAPVVAEAGESLFLLVHGRHVPALAVELEGDAGADTAATDHQRVHGFSLAHSVSEPSSSITPSGTATTSTPSGAFRSTYSTVGEKKRDWRRHLGAEPRTIRSAPLRSASFTIASPIERARTVSP